MNQQRRKQLNFWIAQAKVQSPEMLAQLILTELHQKWVDGFNYAQVNPYLLGDHPIGNQLMEIGLLKD